MCEEYVNLQTNEKLDLDKVNKLKDNAMLKVKPELWVEWDFEKNNELGLDVWEMTKGTHKKVWWICQKCKSSFDSIIYNRVLHQNCTYCRGLKVNHTNSLASLNPELTKQWNYERNGDLTPHDVTCKSNKKVWWLGNCGHEWEAIINDLQSAHNDKGCPYCAGQKILVGFNDMWTTNPELAKLLANPEDGYKYMQWSGKKANFKCLDCGEIIKNKTISNINNNKRLSCPKCSDGVSYPEKFIYNLLSQLSVNFIYQSKFTWSKNKYYDFHISSYDTIVEVHGLQHYDGGFESAGGRTLKEEQANDQYKYELATTNGIENYIVIDARYSKFDYIKDSILNSKLVELFDLSNIDWKDIHRNSVKSLVKVICDIWNNDIKSVTEISKRTKLSTATVIVYLKKGAVAGFCDYKPKAKRNVVQLTKDMIFVKLWSSISDAALNKKNRKPSIGAVCKGIQKSAYGYKWMYLENYEEMIKEKENV